MGGIHLLDISFTKQGQQETITPVLLQDEQETILVDCGYPDFVPLLEEAVGRFGLTLAAVTKLIVTHHDIDHMGSLAALKRLYPQIAIIAHEAEVPYIEGKIKSLRQQQAESPLDAQPEEVKGQVEPFIRFLQSMETVEVDQKVTHGDKLPCCGGIEVIHTPGHMPGHLSLYLAGTKTLITGDAVVIEDGKLAIANPQYTLDLDAAIGSLHRLLDYDFEQIVCYHGGLFAGDGRKALHELIQGYKKR